jgi:hypothetical protein
MALWRPNHGLVEANHGLVEANHCLVKAKRGLVEAIHGLMESTNGLAESADSPVFGRRVPSMADVGTEMRHLAPAIVSIQPPSSRPGASRRAPRLMLRCCRETTRICTRNTDKC